MSKEIELLETKKQDLLKEVRKLETEQDMIEIANVIGEGLGEIPIIEAEEEYAGSFESDKIHNRDAFDRFVEILPKGSYIKGHSRIDGTFSENRYEDFVIIMLDDYTPASIALKYTKTISSYDEHGNPVELDEPSELEFSFNVYCGYSKPMIKVEEDGEKYGNSLSVVRSKYYCCVYIFEGHSNEISLSENGKSLIDVIGVLDLTNFVKKDGEDYTIQQKVKTTDEVK